MTKDEATRTAGARLERIEAWTRATFAAAVASAALLALIAAGVGYGLAEYMQFKWAIADGMKAIQQETSKITPVTRPIRRMP